MEYRLLLVPLVAVTIGACGLYDGKCTYEVRSIQLSGTASQSGTQIAAAEANLSEDRGSLEGAFLYWIIRGSTLKGHVSSASLKDAQNPSQVLVDVALAPADRSEIAEGGADTRAGANLTGYFNIFSAGRGIVELQTDLSSRPTVVIPLEVTASENWTRPNCS